MINYLVAEKGLSRVEAYMLCSVAGDLKLHEVVSSLDRIYRELEAECALLHDR